MRCVTLGKTMSACCAFLLASALALPPVGVAAAAPSAADPSVVQGEYIVVTDGAAASARSVVEDGQNAASGASVEAVSDHAMLVQAGSEEEAASIVEECSEGASVAYVQPNYVYELPEVEGSGEALRDGGASACSSSGSDALARELVPNDPLWNKQSYLHGVGFDEAWDTARVEGAVSVVMLDSVVNMDHEDLFSFVDEGHAWDAVSSETLADDVVPDSHGTRVAGVLSATCNNGMGMAGASYGARAIPVNVYPTGSSKKTTNTAILLRAMGYVFSLAEQDPSLNIRVVNMSLGGYGAGDTTETDRAFHDAVDRAVDEYDMVVVAAGGNDNTSKVSWPADWGNVVSVTSVDTTLQKKAWFSDFNEHKDIAAPGMSIQAPSASNDSGYEQCEGTSFSAPLVSAACALLFSCDPSLSASEAVELLYRTADDLGAPGKDEYFGWGLLDVDEAVRACWSGTSTPSLAYDDVDQNAWYQTPLPYVDYAVSNGYLIGNDYQFRPDDAVTRAEGATVFWRVFEPEESARYDASTTENATSFDDVDDHAWYTGALNWAAANGVINGYSPHECCPNDALTVEQACSILANALASEADIAQADLSVLNRLQDRDAIDSWARANVAWCMEHGLISGAETSGGTYLYPHDSLSRARFAGLLYNLSAEGLLPASASGVAAHEEGAR